MSTIVGTDVIHVLGYANCFGAKDEADIGAKETTTMPAASDDRRRLQQTNSVPTQEDADAERLRKEINCFSYDSSKITGKQGDNQPDHAALSFDVKVEDDTSKALCVYSHQWLGCGGVTVGVVAGIIVTILVVMAVSAAILVATTKKKREEEFDCKAEVKKGADGAESNIDFRIDEMDENMTDLENPDSKMKAERDRLKDENEKLAGDVGEDPMTCADTEDPDVLVEQINSLKFENERLRDMQSGTKAHAGRKKKKKAQGFGQQQQQD